MQSLYNTPGYKMGLVWLCYNNCCKSCRLDESKNRNLKLQEEVRIIKRECESLKQRYEEEALGKEREK